MKDYTAWRITYQCSEQAARAAYRAAQQHLQHVENLRYAGNRVIRGGEGAHVWDLALKALPDDSPLHDKIEELEELASQAAAERDAMKAHMELLSELLVKAKTGLEWYWDAYPEVHSQADEELAAEVEGALAAKPDASLASLIAAAQAAARREMLPLIELLGTISQKAYYLADDTCDDGGEHLLAPRNSMADLEEAFDACEHLPEPEEGLVSEGWNRALRMLRRMAGQDSWLNFTPTETGVGVYCAPGPADTQRPAYLLRYEDHDRGDVVMFDEQQARTAFANAEANGWNAYLFETARRYTEEGR